MRSMLGQCLRFRVILVTLALPLVLGQPLLCFYKVSNKRGPLLKWAMKSGVKHKPRVPAPVLKEHFSKCAATAPLPAYTQSSLESPAYSFVLLGHTGEVPTPPPRQS